MQAEPSQVFSAILFVVVPFEALTWWYGMGVVI